MKLFITKLNGKYNFQHYYTAEQAKSANPGAEVHQVNVDALGSIKSIRRVKC